MSEVAFKVRIDSDFYKEYFLSKRQQQEFHNLARCFFDKHKISNDGRYCLSSVLTVDLNEEQKEKYMSQIKKHTDRNGMYVFKQNSPLQKAWLSEVVEQADLSIAKKMKMWWYSFIIRGSYALWDNGKEIYGYLKTDLTDSIELPEHFERIKMSEYYRAKEKED